MTHQELQPIRSQHRNSYQSSSQPFALYSHLYKRYCTYCIEIKPSFSMQTYFRKWIVRCRCPLNKFLECWDLTLLHRAYSSNTMLWISLLLIYRTSKPTLQTTHPNNHCQDLPQTALLVPFPNLDFTNSISATQVVSLSPWILHGFLHHIVSAISHRILLHTDVQSHPKMVL